MDYYIQINRHSDYSIVPFKSYTNQRYEIVSGSNLNTAEVTIDRADDTPTTWLKTADQDLGFINEISRIPSYTLYKSIEHMFYSTNSLDRIPYSQNNIQDATLFMPSQSCFVVNISQYAYGERVFPGTFRLDLDGSVYDIQDRQSNIDGMGYLYISSSNNVVGNIFYEDGIAVIKENRSATTGSIDPTGGLAIKSGSQATVTFRSQVTIYQHRVVCKVCPTQLNRSIINPSANESLADGTQIQNHMRTGSLTPYVTSIGLYNEQNDLLAVAKLSTPIKRTKYTDQIFIIQFDSIV